MAKLLTDVKFGRLRVIRKTAPETYLCQCDCGNTIELWKSQLWCKVKRHCGCQIVKGHYRRSFINEHVRYFNARGREWKHAKTTWEFNSWKGMKERCYGKTKPEYPNYGGRGIRVCDRWLLPNGEGLRNFCADMDRARRD